MSNRQVQAISLLTLVGAFTLSAGIILRHSALLWVGTGIVGAVFALTVFGLLQVAWFWARSPRPTVTPINCDDRSKSDLRPNDRTPKQTLRSVLIISACGLVAICGVAVALNTRNPFSSPDPQVSERLGGPGKARIIATARTVTAWRTLGSFRDGGDFYEKAGSPVVVPSALAAQLRRILLDPESYLDLEIDKASVTLPCVILNFANSKADMDVFISFADYRLEVKKDDRSQPGSRPMAVGHFDPVQKDLIRLVKQIFPSDQQIQSLTETNWGGTLWPGSQD